MEMITMAGTYVAWLKEQETREQDPVGWFAQFWRDLPDKPRLHAPHSITKHLEERDLFRLTPGLTEAHDAALAEYRKHRERTVRSVASEAGVQVPDDQQPERGLAGQAIDSATEKAVAAAQRHMPDGGQQALQGVQITGQGQSQPLAVRFEDSTSVADRLDRIEHLIREMIRVFGLRIEELGFSAADWDRMYQAADLAAVPDE
jgi:hypothetical protein